MMRTVAATRFFAPLVLYWILIGAVCHAQTTSLTVERFEVASIRPSSGNDNRPSIQFVPGGGLSAMNVTLKLLIQAAYEVRPEQISGGAGWTDSDQYTVIAKPSEVSATASSGGQMELTLRRLQTLLSERFGLSLAHEQKTNFGYILTVDKGGNKMAVSQDPGPPLIRQTGRWEIHAERVPVSLLMRFLEVRLKATINDQTELKEHFNFRLNWTPESAPNQSEPLAEETLIPAVREQLGLHLEGKKVKVNFYTILRAERPSEN